MAGCGQEQRKEGGRDGGETERSSCWIQKQQRLSGKQKLRHISSTSADHIFRVKCGMFFFLFFLLRSHEKAAFGTNTFTAKTFTSAQDTAKG